MTIKEYIKIKELKQIRKYDSEILLISQSIFPCPMDNPQVNFSQIGQSTKLFITFSENPQA